MSTREVKKRKRKRNARRGDAGGRDAVDEAGKAVSSKHRRGRGSEERTNRTEELPMDEVGSGEQ
jgi:hypothetical protein